MPVPQKYSRLLLTGAAGGLGKVLRQRLVTFANTLRLSDRVEFGAANANEEITLCDLADKTAVFELLADVDVVLHFGGMSLEDKFEPILQSNIVGVFNLYEAVRKRGIKRVVFASSNHVTGFYKQTEHIDTVAPQRPDGLYGVSKCFGENLARFYFDRYGIETACLRIGSCFPTIKDRRMLSTYLSADDLVELVRCALFAPVVGHTIIYGASNNTDAWWDSSKAANLGFTPRDSSEPQRARVEAANPPLPANDPGRLFQGGAFTVAGPFDE